jgi:hypothetical protein
MLPYSNQLRAIREMLDNPTEESIQEGYDLLFKLWLTNKEIEEFSQELIQDAIKHPLLIGEFRKRLRELRLKSSITGNYLKDQFEAFVANVESYKSKLATEAKPHPVLLPAKIGISESQTRKLPWWQILRVLILTVSITLILVLPISQKIVVCAIAIISVITMPYLLSKVDQMITTDLPGIKLNYSFPKYLSIGDENTIDLSIENSNENEFTGLITLVFSDNDSLITPVANQSMSVKVEVPAFGREAKQFKFILKNKPPDGDANYYFQVFSSDGSRYKTNSAFFLISPIPYLRSIWGWVISGSGIVALIITFIWEVIWGK